MDKLKIGDKTYLYPNPVVLVGTNVNKVDPMSRTFEKKGLEREKIF
jgi:hypothetical protein